jgi:hypothetical protein
VNQVNGRWFWFVAVLVTALVAIGLALLGNGLLAAVLVLGVLAITVALWFALTG